MRRLTRLLLFAVIPLGLAYVVLCLFLWVTQEARLFRPTVLAAGSTHAFGRPFEEHNIPAGTGVALNTVLFPAPNSRGVVFLLSGNSANVQETAPRFIEPIAGAGYDLFVMDYPGFGKSTGSIRSEADLDSAVLAAYDWLRHLYPEGRTVIAGYSLGSAPASWLACRHHPQRLVLIAPFYNLSEIVAADYPYFPLRLLRYPMRNDVELSHCAPPVTLFHGSADDLIPPSASERLRALLKPSDRLLLFDAAGHLDLPDKPEFRQALRQLLESDVQQLAAAPKGVKIR
jgi:alpha-beta hydrolase superfamily lysophospholipase